MNGSLWVKLTDNIECVINNKTICLWVFYWIAKSIWYSWSQHFTWKNSYTSVAEKTKVNVNYSSKHFSEYMENNSLKSLFLSPTNKNEIWSIISGFNPNKALGPNNIPKKIPKKCLLRMKFHPIFLISMITFSMGVCILITPENCQSHSCT